MRVYADFHHQALYHSLLMLFEDRLGAEVYRAIGPEWYEHGFWKVYDHPATVEQYLGLHQGTTTPVDVHGNPLSPNAQPNKHYKVKDGIFYIWDATHDRVHRAIRLDTFKDLKFDIILSSIPVHIPIFNRLIAEYQPTAKHIFQVGNAWGYQQGIRNILSSTAPFSVPKGINACFYHQELDLSIFKYEPPTNHGIVNSYVHLMQGVNVMDNIAKMFPHWKWTRYGAGFPESLHTSQTVAGAMRDSAFTWHWKPEGDGYGHVIHSTYACGRPAIINVGHYRSKLAEALLTDNVTCIDSGNKSIPELARMLQWWSEPERHKLMCERAYQRFLSVVDFNREEQNIRGFLERLL